MYRRNFARRKTSILAEHGAKIEKTPEKTHTIGWEGCALIEGAPGHAGMQATDKKQLRSAGFAGKQIEVFRLSTKLPAIFAVFSLTGGAMLNKLLSRLDLQQD